MAAAMMSRLRTTFHYLICILVIFICGFAISGSDASLVDRLHLFPTLMPSFEKFRQYPNAQYLKETPWDTFSYSLAFETQDSPEDVEAYYQAIVDEYGWQSETVDLTLASFQDIRYYFGDYGQNHVYGYYLEFYAVPEYFKEYSNLATHAQINIKRSLPFYLGASNAKIHTYKGADTNGTSGDYFVKAEPDAVLAFYKQIMLDQRPGQGWHFVPEKSSAREFYWISNFGSSVSVTIDSQDGDEVHVTIKRSSGCCD